MVRQARANAMSVQPMAECTVRRFRMDISDAGDLTVIEIETGNLVVRLPQAARTRATALSFGWPEHLGVVAEADGRCTIWDLRSRACLSETVAPFPVRSLTLRARGRHILLKGPLGDRILWDWQVGRLRPDWNPTPDTEDEAL